MARSFLVLLVVLAATVASPVALAVGASPGVATPVQREQSQALFVRGKQLFDAKKYADALAWPALLRRLDRVNPGYDA